MSVQEVGLRQADDLVVLEWAANEGRIVVTHDVSTMLDFAYERVAAGLPMPGVFEIPDQTPRSVINEEMLLTSHWRFSEVGADENPGVECNRVPG